MKLTHIILASSLGLLASSVSAEIKRPNIILVLADDLGYADIGVYGCKDIPTPHIDSIAKNGVRFTDGYAPHSLCSPSRAGLMSGRYQHQPGVFTNHHRLWPKATLYDLTKDIGEKTDVADEHPKVVERMLNQARRFDQKFQGQISPALYLPGPRPPAHGQVRTPGDDLTAWHSLVK